MPTPAALVRFWRGSKEYRDRFGTLAGWRVANGIADLNYRKSHLPFVPLAVPGWKEPFWLRPDTTDLDVFRQVIMGGELEMEILPAPRRIVDGGANIGFASRVFAHRWPAAQIVAVELEAGNVEALRKNCEMLPQIQVRHAALWGDRGTVGIDPGEFGALGFRASDAAAGARVPAVPLDELFDELGWDTVDLVKIDIEGAEREVLSSAPRWIDRVTHLVVELHDRFAPGCTEAFEQAISTGDWSVRPYGEYLVASRMTHA